MIAQNVWSFFYYLQYCPLTSVLSDYPLGLPPTKSIINVNLNNLFIDDINFVIVNCDVVD